MLWLILILFVLVYAYSKIKSVLSYWEYKKIKFVKPRFLLGNMEMFPSKASTDLITELYSKFPDERYHGVYQFLRPTLMIKDPDLIKLITVKEFENFLDHRTFVSPDVDPVWNKNLFAATGERWRDMRTTLSPSFTSSKMKTMFFLMDECARQFVDYFKNQESEITELEMKETLARYTNDVIATTAFGLKCDSLRDRDNTFFVSGRKMADLSGLRRVKFFLNMISPTLAKLLRFKLIPEDVADYFTNIVKETVKIREENHIVRPDMIHLLMEARKTRQSHDEEVKVDEGFSSVKETLKSTKKREITTDDIASQAIIFFFAGFDTVSTGITFLFYELGINPDIQNKLREEIKTAATKSGGKITYELLLGMKYMDMVVSEAFRKWPPTVVTDRIVTKPFTIQPTKLGEKPLDLDVGVVCWLPMFAIHRDARFYQDPERFDPERFNDENKHKINPSTYFPFGAGPRNCIGSRFALLEIKLLTYHILSEFEIVPVKKTNVPMVLDKAQFSLTSKGGMWLGLKKIA